MKHFVLLLPLMLFLLVATACAANTSAAPVQTAMVLMPKSYRFSPAVIEVKAGTTVTWRNDDNFTHDVKLLPDGETHVVRPGESVQIKFDQPGTYDYICTFHATDMKGKVVVTGSR